MGYLQCPSLYPERLLSSSALLTWSCVAGLAGLSQLALLPAVVAGLGGVLGEGGAHNLRSGGKK